MSNFKNRILELRTERQLTQTLIANKINVSVSSISRYERGEMEPTLDIAIRLCDVFNVTMEWLTGEDDIHKDKLPKDYVDFMYKVYKENVPIDLLEKYYNAFKELNK